MVGLGQVKKVQQPRHLIPKKLPVKVEWLKRAQTMMMKTRLYRRAEVRIKDKRISTKDCLTQTVSLA